MRSTVYALLIACGIVLAVRPALWLVQTWTEPGYDHYPAVVFAVVVGLFLWSVSSPYRAFTESGRDRDRGRRLAVGLLLGTLGVRFASQILAVNVLGAFALAIDVYALASLAGLNARRRAIAPGWLGLLFLFCLPVEPIFQRSVGYLLQQVSASGACHLLGAFFTPVDCLGTRILLMGREVLVDVPCSGARLLTTLLMTLTLLGAVTRPTVAGGIMGLGITLVSAFAANVVRIGVLAIGIVFRELSGVDVMGPPWHELIGLLSVALGTLPLLWWAVRNPHRQPTTIFPRQPTAQSRTHPAATLTGAVAALLVAAWIVQLTPRPLDTSAPLEMPLQPAILAGYGGAPTGLSAQETRYFTRYGGAAQRTFYGPFTLLLVTTTSPLRHLHAPDVCLAGAGHRVRYLTTRFTGAPTAFYSSQSEADTYRVRVSFVSASGRVATNVSEVVWHWLRDPGEAWTMVQRIAPAEVTDREFERWDAAVARAYNLHNGAAPPREVPGNTREEVTWPEFSI